MRRWVTLTAICGLAASFSTVCHAEDESEQIRPEISREEWQARIAASRNRAETVRRERRNLVPTPPSFEELAEEASKRALEDDSLKPGDVVSTNRGLFRFEGIPDRARKPEDFVRIR